MATITVSVSLLKGAKTFSYNVTGAKGGTGTNPEISGSQQITWQLNSPDGLTVEWAENGIHFEPTQNTPDEWPNEQPVLNDNNEYTVMDEISFAGGTYNYFVNVMVGSEGKPPELWRHDPDLTNTPP